MFRVDGPLSSIIAEADSGSLWPGGYSPRSIVRCRGSQGARGVRVVSDKMNKMIVVELENRDRHPLYGKIIRTTSKGEAHDENEVAGIGDRVQLMETRPLSATKRWRSVEVPEDRVISLHG
ncbi:30S ribosomal protein S17 [Nocardia sp. NBC_01730]|nr:30S ribosomal protein S17 [Nocardia sp. NBC_01730]